MAAAETNPKPVSKCQSCGEISSLAHDEEDKVAKTSKSHSIAEMGPLTGAGESKRPNDPSTEKSEEPAGDEVWCDFCLESKVKAVKTCLTCVVNYCTTHLRPHMDNPKLHSHQLVPPVNDAALRSCSLHNKPLEWFCKEHLMCICEECVMGEHKDDNPIPCAKARKQVEVRPKLRSNPHSVKEDTRGSVHPIV